MQTAEEPPHQQLVQVEPPQQRALVTALAGEAAFAGEEAGSVGAEVASVLGQAASADVVAAVELLVFEVGWLDVVASPDAAAPQSRADPHQQTMAPCKKKHQAT